MPKIPTYQRQYTTKPESGNALMDVGSAGIVGNAIQRFGATAMDAADLIERTNQHLEDRQSRIDAVDRTDKLNKTIINLLHNPDTGIFSTRKEKLSYGVGKDVEKMLKDEETKAFQGASPKTLEHAKGLVGEITSARLHEAFTFEANERQKDLVRAIKDVDVNAAENIAKLKSPVSAVEEIDQAISLKKMLSPTGDISDAEELSTSGNLAYIAAQAALNDGNAADARAIIGKYSKELDALKLRDDLLTKMKVVDKDNTATALVVELKKKYGDDYGAITKEINSPEFIEKNGIDIQERLQNNFAAQENRANAAYKEAAEPIKGELQVDILSGKIQKDKLPKDKRWLALKAPDRAVISNYADAKSRSDRAENNNERSLKVAERQAKRQQQQEEAVIFRGKVLTKIAEGGYLDTTQIIQEHSTDNPYILGDVNSSISLFKSIESSPELKVGITAINDAAKQGLLDPSNYTNNLFKKGALATELRTKYLTDQEFRGEKINQWLKEKITPEVRKGFGAKLDSLFSKSKATGPSQEDLEYTAKKHNISVDEVKRRLGK